MVRLGYETESLDAVGLEEKGTQEESLVAEYRWPAEKQHKNASFSEIHLCGRLATPEAEKTGAVLVCPQTKPPKSPTVYHDAFCEINPSRRHGSSRA
jgi:hypothetical protein